MWVQKALGIAQQCRVGRAQRCSVWTAFHSEQSHRAACGTIPHPHPAAHREVGQPPAGPPEASCGELGLAIGLSSLTSHSLLSKLQRASWRLVQLE